MVGGVAGHVYRARIAGTVERTREAVDPVHPTSLYGAVLGTAERAGGSLDSAVHDGLIRSYVTWSLGAACLMSLLGYAAASATLPADALTTVETPTAMALILGVAALATVAVAAASSHVTGVLTLSILGFTVAIFYILASGPDLALTQLVVETLLLLIFLLVIEELPAFYSDLRNSVAVRDGLVSVVVGATAFVTVLVAAPSDDGLSDTARFYVQNAVPEGGGANVVNVVLTDFRAFDTLGEATVIVIATVSVLVLLIMRSRGERR